MDYRCHVRTLLRTLGYAAGLSLGVTAAMAGAPKPTDGKAQHMLATPFWSDQIDPSQIIVFPGGDGEWDPQNVNRADPCSGLGDANGYDRAPGSATYPTIILGRFNDDEFYMADDFRPAQNGNINRVCWNGLFSLPSCDGDLTDVDEWTIRFYDFDAGNSGLPGALLATYRNFGGSANMTVAQGTTGLPVGINATLVEHSFHATLSTTLAVSAENCYYMELYQDSQRPCFYLQSLSYEPSIDPTAEGNRSLLRRNNRLFPVFGTTDFINLDLVMKIGFTTNITLQASNAFDSCFNRPAPGNDNIAGATLLNCNAASTLFDNTYATYIVGPAGVDPVSCRKSVVDPVDQTNCDVWFRFNPGVNTSAKVTLCASNITGGLAGGDSLMQVFRLTNTGNPAALTNLTLVGCSDDACGVLSEVNALGLTNQTYYVRISGFTPVSAGQYRILVQCPIPVAENDTCAVPNTTAFTIPADTSVNGYRNAVGTQRTADNATGSSDGNVRSCIAFGNSARGLWFKLTGSGNSILVSTNNPGSSPLFDVSLSVYCGTCDASGSGLRCVAANDDISTTNPGAELTFCGHAGRDYYILVKGMGLTGAGQTQTGVAVVLFRELRDTGNQPLTCCDPQVCDPTPCPFTIPANATQEDGQFGVVPTITTEVCVSNGTFDNTTQFNAACALTPPGGEPRRYGNIALGQTIWGDAWAHLQFRDHDWFYYPGLEPGGARTLLRYRVATQAPIRFIFHDWTLTNFATCSPAGAFAFSDFAGCPQVLDRSHVFDGTSTNRQGVAPGGAMAFRIFSIATSDGFPCGTNTQYWYTLIDRVPVANCVAVATQPGDDDEDTVITFDGTGGDDGFTHGEPCYDVAPAPPDAIARKAGCGAPTVTNGEFLRLTPNVPMVGKVQSKVGTGGATRDIDYYKMQLTGGKALVRLNIESAYVFTALITNNDCTTNSITHAIAGTRGHCISGALDADDLVVLDAGIYIVYAFSTDAFVALGSGANFSNYFCPDPISKYRLTVTTSPLPDCTEPICPPGAVAEAEVCTTDDEEMFKACDALADNSAVVGGDNDGCSRSVFAADAIAPGTPVCGTLYSVYLPFPDDDFLVDQDYWQFSVNVPTRLTYKLRANGAARVLVAETGAPFDSPTNDRRTKNGGSLCYNPEVPLRVLGGEDAGSCVDGDEGVLYLAPGWYSMIVSPGSIDVGLSVGSYACGSEISYSLSINTEALGSCCVGNDCITTTAADCSFIGGTGFTAGQLCGETYTASTSSASLTSIAGAPGAVQITGLGDDNVVATTMTANFKLFGRTYTPSQIGVSANGYIVLGNTDESATPRIYPNTALPNAQIAPLFHDFDLSAHGTVWILTTGTFPNETTTIEWNNVPSRENYQQRATFQVRLLRPSWTIEFVYGNMTSHWAKLDTTTLDGDPIEGSAGIEDETGLNGKNVPLTGAILAGGQKVTLLHNSVDTPCNTAVPPCCPGNASKTTGPGADVNFADITVVLANFNQPANPNGTSPGDADCNGFINFADITSVLANFNNDCD